MPTDNPTQTSDRLLRWAVFVGLGSFLCALISYNFVDIDLWHQMALIRESLSSGHLLKTDPYAYTPTIYPIVDHEWGAGLIAYFSTVWFGSRAILVLKFLLALGTGFLCLRCSKRRRTDVRLLGACAPLAILLTQLGFFSVIRAQAYTFFLTALLLLLWEIDREGGRTWILIWLPIFVLWLNVHGGFVVAIGLTGLHLVEELLRRNPVRHLSILLSGMLAAVFLNPYGIAYLSYLKRALTMARPYSPEWGPVSGLGTTLTIVFVAAVLMLLYAVASVGLRQATGILPLSATVIEAALHRKLLPLFAVVWLCYVPSYLQRTRAGEWFLQFAQKRSRFLLAAWIACACICLASTIRQKPWRLDIPQPIYPVGPVEYLAQQKFSGNLLVPFRLGSYVSWKLFPALKVSLDSRYEVAYPDRVMEMVFNFYEARPGWQAALNDYPTDGILVPLEAPVWKEMRATGWTRTYVDKQFELYVRSGIPLPFEDRSSASFSGVFP
jgi:hypothetical protein